MAPFESAKLAAIVRNAPAGYGYTDAPRALSDRIELKFRQNADLEGLVGGASIHAVVRNSDETTIAMVVLVELDPFITKLPDAERQMMEGVAGELSGVQQIRIAGTTWEKGTASSDDATFLGYARIKDSVMILVMGSPGSSAAGIEAFLGVADTMK